MKRKMVAWLCLMVVPHFAVGAEVRSTKIVASALTDEHIAFTGALVSAWSVQDKRGRHILVLTSLAGPSRARPNLQRNERIDLRASYFGAGKAAWNEEWNIKDAVDCPHVDSSAAFFANSVTVTDLNNDGIAEITVPYKMFCGGGIDPDTVKVILRQGSVKLALRGESQVRIPGQEPFGGSYTSDKALSLPKNVTYKNHLERVWSKVYIRSYSN
jgi:hypothetical protein